MIDLDEVISKVERIELSADTRRLHLAHLHALQAAPPGRRSIGSGVPESIGPRRSRAVLAGVLAAASVAVVAGASALLVPAHHPPAVVTPGTGSNPATSRSYVPTDRQTGPTQTTGSKARALSDAAFSKQLAVILGLSGAQATAVTAELDKLGRYGGLDPNSAQFAQIAAGAGVKPVQLAAAIDQIKKAALATSASTRTGQSKDSDLKGPGTQPAPGDPSGALAKSTAQNSQNLLTTQKGVGLLASTLGLSRQKSADLAKQLTVLENGGGLEPRASGFRSIANDFGLTADQLAAAIEKIKKAGN